VLLEVEADDKDGYRVDYEEDVREGEEDTHYTVDALDEHDDRDHDEEGQVNGQGEGTQGH
jgi:hypothetical protein